MRKKLPVCYRSSSDIWRYEIQLDLTIELIDFCLKKGFTLNQILLCLNLQHSIIRFIRKASSKLNSTLDFLIENLKNHSTDFNDKNMKDFIDYMHNTCLSHYNLYKYVFTFDRDDLTQSEKKVLIVPGKEMCEGNRLAESKPYHIWDYEQKLAELENKEKANAKKFQEEQRKLLSEEEMAKNLIRYIQNNANGSDKPLDEEVELK